MGILGDRLKRLFTNCLRTGQFPEKWKIGKLVLLRKAGRLAESPSAYRPICLLDEAGKLLKKIIAARLRRHLQETGPDLADCQFGFREERSTIDAILRVRTITEEAVSRGEVAMGVSLDISNAFNTLPWDCIIGALKYHRVPLYLQSTIRDCRGRSIQYMGRQAIPLQKVMERGVPQGSVLGPLLWNNGYNWVLRGALPPGLNLTCYADDTMVLVRGAT